MTNTNNTLKTRIYKSQTVINAEHISVHDGYGSSVYFLTDSSPNCSSSPYYALDQTNDDLMFNLNIFRYFQDAEFFKTFNILLDIFNYKRVERARLKIHV